MGDTLHTVGNLVSDGFGVVQHTYWAAADSLCGDPVGEREDLDRRDDYLYKVGRDWNDLFGDDTSSADPTCSGEIPAPYGDDEGEGDPGSCRTGADGRPTCQPYGTEDAPRCEGPAPVPPAAGDGQPPEGDDSAPDAGDASAPACVDESAQADDAGAGEQD